MKSERERQRLYIDTYIQNLERQYQWSYIQGSEGDTDLKNWLLDFSIQWEERVGWFERIALKRIHWHMWNRQPVGVWCTMQGTHSRCSMTVWRNGAGREAEGVSGARAQCLWPIHAGVGPKPAQYCQVISSQFRETLFKSIFKWKKAMIVSIAFSWTIWVTLTNYRTEGGSWDPLVVIRQNCE